MIIDNNYIHQYCPLCRSPKIKKLGLIKYADPLYFSTCKISLTIQPELWECDHCESRFTQNAIPEAVAYNLYKNGEGGKRWSGKNFEGSKTKQVFELLNSLLKKDLNVLDVGCNTGEFLDLAKSKDCRTSGIDWCSSSREIIKHKGHNAFSSLEEINEVYDVITAFDLVEHLYNLPDFFNWCALHLAKNGKLVFLTGDISSLMSRLMSSKWWYVRFPEHIVFPSSKYFKDYTGFSLEKVSHTYASKADESILRRIKYIAYQLAKQDFSGLPLTYDHIIMVLGK